MTLEKQVLGQIIHTSGSISCSSYSSWSSSAALRPLRMASSSMSLGSDMVPEAVTHIYTHTLIHCCAPLGKRALPVKKGGKEERTISLYTLLSKIFFLSYLGFFYCVLFPTLFYLSCAVTYYVRNSYNNISFIVKSLALTVNHARQRSDWVLF